MNDTLLTYLISFVLITVSVVPYVASRRKKETRARERFEELKMIGLHETSTMHPHIDITVCIGCGGCVKACPEEGVLGIIEGKAALIHGAKCVGHGMCAEACPVGAIEMLMASPSRSASLPVLKQNFETNIPGIYIVGELGGIGLIRNAIEQGKAAVEHISVSRTPHRADYDIAVVGAGPGGLAAGLTAKKNNLKYVVLEQGDIGGAILHYPRAKVVMTSPVELPLWGKIKLRETKKEALVDLWREIIEQTALQVCLNEKVLDVTKVNGFLSLTTTNRTVTASSVVLALGRRGTPRKLGVPGEELPKVMYRLIDASHYNESRIMIVGGGDSAVEAAVGLSLQQDNIVTVSYRKQEFTRIKERNRRNLQEKVSRKKATVIYNSELKEIREGSVILKTTDGELEIPNDYVFIFAGGELPFEFLGKAGIEMYQQQV
jgi:putative YpdA family bacillithiol system oxidoreductase